MYVCVCLCLSVHGCVCITVRMFMCVHVHASVCLKICIDIMHAFMHVWVCAFRSVRVLVGVYDFIREPL